MVRVEVGLVHAGIGSNERDTFFLLFYAFHGGFITIDENDGDIPAIYVIYCKNSL